MPESALVAAIARHELEKMSGNRFLELAEAAAREAVAAERERCAKIAEDMCRGRHMKDYPMTTATFIANAIRNQEG
jgi:hypothetical protein